MKKTYTILAFCGLFLLGSCGFLEEESQSEMIPQTTEDFSELLIGSGYPDNTSPDISILTYLDDDCAQMLNLIKKQQGWDQVTWEEIFTIYEADHYAGDEQTVTVAPYYQWQPDMADFNGYQERINENASETMYYQFYQKIKGCNAVLDFIDGAIGSADQRDRVKAEALAIRALLYFQLVNIYGEPYNYNKNALGVPLKLDSNLSNEPIARATVAEVYEKVLVPDLVEAARLMDPLPYIAGNYRINQPAIHILLSRVYLYMEQYQNCIDEVEKAMDFGIRVMNLTTEFNPSDVSVYGYNPFDYTNPEVIWLFGPSPRINNEGYKLAMHDEFQALWDKTNDIRYTMFELGNMNFSMEGTDYDNSDYIITKPYGSTQLCQNIRTSEAVLNAMEANALLGNESDALAALNDFRSTRITGYADVSLSGDDLLEAIRTERRKELCYEGHRWFDLRRQGMPEITHVYRPEKGGQTYVYTLRHNDPMYTLPLPSCLFDQNSALVQNESRNSGTRTGELVTE